MKFSYQHLWRISWSKLLGTLSVTLGYGMVGLWKFIPRLTSLIMLHFPSTLRLRGGSIGCSNFCEALPNLWLLLDHIQLTLKPPATLA